MTTAAQPGSPVGPVDLLLARCHEMGVDLAPAAAADLVALLDRMAVEPQNLTAIEDVRDGVERHLADSLAAAGLPLLAGERSVVDLGSGGGFPGIALAIARPGLAVTLVESEKRKAEWLRRASAGLPNVRVVADRSESLATAERERFAVATARALGPLPVVLELAAPLLAPGGTLLAWRGQRAEEEEARGVMAAAALGLEPGAVHPVRPFPGAARHLHEYVKTGPTPARYPRRPGRAAKRPLA